MVDVLGPSERECPSESGALSLSFLSDRKEDVFRGRAVGEVVAFVFLEEFVRDKAERIAIMREGGGPTGPALLGKQRGTGRKGGSSRRASGGPALCWRWPARSLSLQTGNASVKVPTKSGQKETTRPLFLDRTH